MKIYSVSLVQLKIVPAFLEKKNRLIRVYATRQFTFLVDFHREHLYSASSFVDCLFNFSRLYIGLREPLKAGSVILLCAYFFSSTPHLFYSLTFLISSALLSAFSALCIYNYMFWSSCALCVLLMRFLKYNFVLLSMRITKMRFNKISFHNVQQFLTNTKLF